ncbi:hypothetical protein ASZ90_019790 [hydrocarbon metagenome]|uniref:Uncharacterized protein n=1 Tax=hydrocarbon metagenome TaxID=938273 RepID=A0A0W8E2C7_9ZZZZ
MSSLNTALIIFKKLLDRGQLDRDSDGDLFLEYRSGEVRSILAQMEEEMEFTIVEAGSTLYLVPDSSNGLLGFVSKDLREWVASDARLLDSYLLCYIVMFMLYLFYGGRNRNPKQRDYLRVSKLSEELDQRLGLALLEQEGAAGLEERYGINFIKIAELWESKQDYEEKARKTKTGTILNTCRLLERHNLIRLVDNEREIRCTRKLDDLMLNYYLSDSRVEEIQALFEGGAEAHAQY